MKRYILLFLLMYATNLFAQYAPQAGLQGSTAIFKDSIIFLDWANNCTINRGWMNIADTLLGKVSNGINIDANGIADGNVVSLGDGGEAIYYFDNPIVNGVGADFAVFENGFRSSIDSNLSYMELAFVEVSNDGIHYTQFPAISNLDTSIQMAGYGEYADCRKVNNLAGKYIANYGTPFDLDVFLPLSSININDIRYIKIKDVVGSLSKNYCSYDSSQSMINDPYPTDFTTGGFDLDALGVIHHKYPTTINGIENKKLITLFPNPCTDFLNIKSTEKIKSFMIFSVEGKRVFLNENNKEKINIVSLNEGLYFLLIETVNGKKVTEYFSKQS